MTINSTIIESTKGGKDRGWNRGRRVKGWLLGGLNEASPLLLRMTKGLPDPGSHPAQMGIGISCCEGFPKKRYTMWGVYEVSRLSEA